MLDEASTWRMGAPGLVYKWLVLHFHVFEPFILGHLEGVPTTRSLGDLYTIIPWLLWLLTNRKAAPVGLSALNGKKSSKHYGNFWGSTSTYGLGIRNTELNRNVSEPTNFQLARRSGRKKMMNLWGTQATPWNMSHPKIFVEVPSCSWKMVDKISIALFWFILEMIYFSVVKHSNAKPFCTQKVAQVPSKGYQSSSINSQMFWTKNNKISTT